MVKYYEGNFIGEGKRFGIVLSRFNDLIGRRLLDGALDALIRHGVADGRRRGGAGARRVRDPASPPRRWPRAAASTPSSPSAPLSAAPRRTSTTSRRKRSKGIATVALQADVPVLFGIITTDTIEQAIERAGTKAGNKGYDAAIAAIEMANLLGKVREGV